jgi:uncharacterized RDD family membrane protein YckC
VLIESAARPTAESLSPPLRRLGGALLDGALLVGTLGVGWLAWSFVVWGRGQSPAKQLLRMRVVHARTGRPVGRGTMAFRELVAKVAFVGGIGLAAAALCLVAGISTSAGVFVVGVVVAIAGAWFVWDPAGEAIWDKVVTTLVVDEPRAPGPEPEALDEAPPEPLEPAERPREAGGMVDITFNRAVDYLNYGKFEVGLRLMRDCVDLAYRYYDRVALDRVAKLLAEARTTAPKDLVWLVDDVARDVRRAVNRLDRRA